MDIFIRQIVNGLVLGSVYALITLSYTVVYGILDVINFAHGNILMVGAISALTAISFLQKYLPSLPDWLTLVFALLFAMPICAIVAYTIERVAYRPLRNTPCLTPLIMVISTSIVLQTLAMIIWSHNPLTFPQLLPSNPISIGSTDATITGRETVIILVSILVVVGLILLVNRTKLDRAIRATAENQHMVGLVDVNPNFVISVTFMIGAAMTAVADAVMATSYGNVHFYMGFIPGLKAFTATILGGIGDLADAMIGGMLLSLVEALSAGYISDLTGGVPNSNYQDMFAFIVLIGVLLSRLSGIMGERVADHA